ncbi:hypothetical protein [Chryseobacterium sp. JK1]|uniref:hypothetical protein n=1 Tax=Chryseobacterium sp. JK1 TaxID=874294 RepID=UPI003D69F4E7
MEHPLKNFCKTYRLETVVISNPGTSYSSAKSYVRTTEVYHLGNEKEYFKYHVLVVDFNFSNDDNSMGKLLKQISYLFDELEVSVDQHGNIVKIDNLNALRLRWIATVTKLSENHEGDAINQYFSQISSLLEDENKLIDFLSKDHMFGLLFNGLLQSFDEPKKRITPEGFTEITHPVKNGNTVTLTISPENLDSTDVEHFRGLFVFKEGHHEEGFTEIIKDNTHLKHSLLWIG